MSSVVGILVAVFQWCVALLPKLWGIIQAALPYLMKIFPIIGKIFEWILNLPTKKDKPEEPIEEECKTKIEYVLYCKNCHCEKCEKLHDEMMKKEKEKMIDGGSSEF